MGGVDRGVGLQFGGAANRAAQLLVPVGTGAAQAVVADGQAWEVGQAGLCGAVLPKDAGFGVHLDHGAGKVGHMGRPCAVKHDAPAVRVAFEDAHVVGERGGVHGVGGVFELLLEIGPGDVVVDMDAHVVARDLGGRRLTGGVHGREDAFFKRGIAFAHHEAGAFHDADKVVAVDPLACPGCAVLGQIGPDISLDHRLDGGDIGVCVGGVAHGSSGSSQVWQSA